MNKRTMFTFGNGIYMMVSTFLLVITPKGPEIMFPLFFGLIGVLIAIGISINCSFSTEIIVPKRVLFYRLSKHIVIETDGHLFTLTDDNRIFYKLTEDNKGQLTITVSRDYWGYVNERTLKLNDEPKAE